MNGLGGDLFAIVYDAKTKRVQRAERQRALGGRRHAGGIPAPRLRRDPVSRRALDQRPGRRRRLERAARALRHAEARSRARAGDRLRARRLRRLRHHRHAVEGRRADPAERCRRRRRRSFPAATPPRRATSSATRAWRRPSSSSRRAGATRSTRARSPRRSPTTCGAARRSSPRPTSRRTGADWVEPISTTYRGYDVLEMPPNTQGVVALEMLNILEGFDLKSMRHNSAEYLHLLVEAKRIAFADRDAWLADSDAVPPEALKRMLSKAYAARAPPADQPAAGREGLRSADDRRIRADARANRRRPAATRST